MAEAPAGSAWREQIPTVSDKCDQCLACTLFCPQGALQQGESRVAVNLRLCDGCGICAVECPPGAIVLAAEYTGNRGLFPLKEGSV